MSDHEDLFTEFALAVYMDHHEAASGVTFTQPGEATGTAYDGVIHAERREESQEGEEVVVRYARMVQVQQADVTPATNWKATVSSVDYSVRSITDGRNGLWDVDLERTGSAEISRPQYRGRRV